MSSDNYNYQNSNYKSHSINAFLPILDEFMLNGWQLTDCLDKLSCVYWTKII